MGALIAVNALLECMITGLFGALFLLLFTKLGWLPMLIVTEAPEEEEEDEVHL